MLFAGLVLIFFLAVFTAVLFSVVYQTLMDL